MSDTRAYTHEMQAVVPDNSGKLIVKKIKTPVPGPGEVLVKIAAAPVNPSDLVRIHMAMNDQSHEPFIPGLEGSGTVVAAGNGFLPALWLGKRVACSSKYTTSGTWAEYMITPATMCFPLNRKVSDEQGSMTLVNPLTAIAFIEKIRRGKHRAFINNAAASSLGRMLEFLAGKYKIPLINIVRKQQHVENLNKSGSIYVLNSSSPSFITDLGILAEKLGATIFFDTVCGSDFTEIAAVLPPGSSVIVYGKRSDNVNVMVNPRTLMDKNITISGFYLGSYAKESGLIKNILNLRKTGILMSKGMKINFRGRFPLEKVQEAVDTYLGNMSEGKVLLMPGHQTTY